MDFVKSTLERLVKKRMSLLEEYEKLENRKRIIANKIRKMAKFDSQKKRKERSRRLFQKGGIVEMILGDSCDEEFFIGCLLSIKKIEVDSEAYLKFKEVGKNYLQQKESEK